MESIKHSENRVLCNKRDRKRVRNSEMRIKCEEGVYKGRKTEEGLGKAETAKMVGRIRGGTGDERQFSKGYQTQKGTLINFLKEFTKRTIKLKSSERDEQNKNRVIIFDQ